MKGLVGGGDTGKEIQTFIKLYIEDEWAYEDQSAVYTKQLSWPAWNLHDLQFCLVVPLVLVVQLLLDLPVVTTKAICENIKKQNKNIVDNKRSGIMKIHLFKHIYKLTKQLYTKICEMAGYTII